MDSEQYEEAVRDYEKIYKLDKTRGEIVAFSALFVLSC